MPLASRYALRGRVVTMNDARKVLGDGVVYVDGRTIAAIQSATTPPPDGFDKVTPLQTRGTIYPGLIELHNHLAYNALPLFRPPQQYKNRDQWRGKPMTQRYMSGPAGVLARVSGAVEATVRYVECKCLVGGVTTSQGITLQTFQVKRFFKGVVRNAESPDDDELPIAKPKVGDVDDSPDAAQDFLKTLTTGSGARLLHLAEGVDDVARAYFTRLRIDDDHWAINDRLAGIHATGLRPSDLTTLHKFGGSIVWSPFSNLALYGKTTDIGRALDKGIPVALGSDWSPSGSKNLLGEMKVARLYCDDIGVGLDDRALVEMVTTNPARILGWSHKLGSVESGKLADLVVIAGKTGDAYTHLVQATEADVALVVVDGRACYGRPHLVGAVAPVTDTTNVAGRPMAFSLVADAVLGDVRLADATDKLTDTLGNLVDLASGLANADLGVVSASTVNGADREDRWFIELDGDVPDPFASAVLAGASYPDVAINLDLDPLAAHGDNAFFDQLANLVNLPTAIRDGLPDYYGETARKPKPVVDADVDAVRGLEIVASDNPIIDLADLRAQPDRLRPADRRRIVDQAIVVLSELYVHLPLKRAMHAVDPVQRLRLLQHRLVDSHDSRHQSDLDFHDEITAVFTSLRDLHTHYVLPAPFRTLTAYLPFLVERCTDDRGVVRFIVTKVARGFSAPPFGAGVEVTHWNGVPIQRAVELLADEQGGSNMDARLARGLDALVIRSLARMLAPDEDWVVVTYRTDRGEERELRQHWLVQQPDDPIVFDDASADASVAVLGLDAQTEAVNRARRDLYSRVVADARRMIAAPSASGATTADASAADAETDLAATDEVPTSMPTVFRARKRSVGGRDVGHLRIFTFLVLDVDQFVDEFVRLVETLPPDGLIVDVRGNGGGNINAAERLLQTLTPHHITPQPAQFINSPLVRTLCEANAPSREIATLDLREWIPSVIQAVETGATYSLGFPLTSDTAANALGQRYYGPVVLITDARCYSATDIFAAGFRDHEIGPILGTEGNTGAGGANVWTHQLLRTLLGRRGGGALKELPDGASFTVAIRRTTRVGRNAGAVLEDLGIVPDRVAPLTERDLLSDNEDLLAAAVELLGAGTARELRADIDGSDVKVTFEHLDRIDVFVDDRPRGTFDLADEECRFVLEPVPGEGATIDLRGYETGTLVAARRYVF